MSDNMRRRFLAAMGGLTGAAYLAREHLLPGLPDFLMGLVLGLGLTCGVMGLLSGECLAKLRRWKRRG